MITEFTGKFFYTARTDAGQLIFADQKNDCDLYLLKWSSAPEKPCEDVELKFQAIDLR